MHPAAYPWRLTSQACMEPPPLDYGAASTLSDNDDAAASESRTSNVSPLDAPSAIPSHLSTYTAGEDAGRLATLAKEFGLSRTRAPKTQIRERIPESLEKLNLYSLKASACFFPSFAKIMAVVLFRWRSSANAARCSLFYQIVAWYTMFHHLAGLV